MRSTKTTTLAALSLGLGILTLLTFTLGDPLSMLQSAHMPARTAAPPPEPPPVVYDQFGIERDRFQTVDRRIRRNETFAEILTAHDVPYDKVIELADVARPVFDVRHLRAGRSLRIYTPDSVGTPEYLVYERDPINYVVFQIGDSLGVYEGQRPVTVEQRQISSIIDGSLYATLDRLGVDPRLATKLSEVFAWQIDFFRIQKGDGFSVIFEERLVDGEPIEPGRILAARFNHFSQDYYGILYETGDKADYYDQDGNSLRKAFLKAPLKYQRISSRYSLRRFHPVQKRYKAHLGTDYAAATGTPILAVGDGVVLEATFKRNNGNYVKIRHNGTYTTGYLHMSKIGRGIRPGTRVRQGDVIGYVGSTGLATGPHLCYRFWKNGQQVDPLQETFPSANPIPDAYRAGFLQHRDMLLPLLDGLPAEQYATGNETGASSLL